VLQQAFTETIELFEDELSIIPILRMDGLVVRNQENAIPRIIQLSTGQFCNACDVQFIRSGLINGFQYLDPAALSIREFLAKHSIPVVPHLPYQIWHSATSCLRLKIALEGKRFQLTA